MPRHVQNVLKISKWPFLLRKSKENDIEKNVVPIKSNIASAVVKAFFSNKLPIETKIVLRIML